MRKYRRAVRIGREIDGIYATINTMDRLVSLIPGHRDGGHLGRRQRKAAEALNGISLPADSPPELTRYNLNGILLQIRCRLHKPANAE